MDGAYKAVLSALVAAPFGPDALEALRCWRKVTGVTDEQHRQVGAALRGTQPAHGAPQVLAKLKLTDAGLRERAERSVNEGAPL